MNKMKKKATPNKALRELLVKHTFRNKDCSLNEQFLRYYNIGITKNAHFMLSYVSFWVYIGDTCNEPVSLLQHLLPNVHSFYLGPYITPGVPCHAVWRMQGQLNI